MTIRFGKTVALTLAAGLAASAALAANTMVGGAEMMPDKTIVENASMSADHSTLVAAVTAAGLAETLSGPGPFTVFAPTNAAFEKLPKGTVEDLLKPENKDKLTQILTCHVVGAEAMSPAIGKMIKDDGGSHAVKTLGGCTLTASINAENNALQLTDENGNVATVTIPDVDQSNGVIHVIDTVLLPKM
ncbi:MULTISPECIES: fasciclin domain-containing protein [unclassified Paracoccus (in: a-proteobacteria)]|uniref:fasciclin domain-containing protein n=1 Tax=unclassified Paracoccus (in: a-proteobacteria) TaxID=2688777 RepID=UPI0012B3D9F4|nr:MULTISPECIES: fasciclin domain-containing protein [unclassified Paracoccus (in: a-proteobacteria)]UXU75160.1 fasciclin domain-containing protein [Paracoccus sp. SMMA_5]UXU81062.1 fasciclin domain-containing protein [Paracoccus sp. SMMA_5_TC]